MKNNKNMTLHHRLRYILLSFLIPLLLAICVLLLLLIYFESKYTRITHNVNVSSEFSIDFKSNMDLKMYHYTIGSREQIELPLEDVDDAIALADSLRKTTICKEGKQSIENVRNYCENLKRRMIEIRDTTDYDTRQTQLNNNIYVLTDLVQESMMDYIYYEAGYLAGMEKDVRFDMTIAIILVAVFTFLCVTVLLNHAFRFSRNITEPINELCGNVRKIGDGNFGITSVNATNIEIQVLDEGIQKMAGQMVALLDNVKKEEQLQHLTQLQLLQAQVSPHFLYNTLDTIVWLVESNQNEDAVKMISSLSIFFRTSLSKGNDLITLAEEVSHTRSYLEIQQVRYRDILDYVITIPEELLGFHLPKLTLQPLVENALYHGVKMRRGGGSIEITGKKVFDGIELEVKDNGIGMTKERVAQVGEGLQDGSVIGFGISAVDERIKLYCGNEYGVSIRSEEGVGTVVLVRISDNIQQQK